MTFKKLLNKIRYMINKSTKNLSFDGKWIPLCNNHFEEVAKFFRSIGIDISRYALELNDKNEEALRCTTCLAEPIFKKYNDELWNGKFINGNLKLTENNIYNRKASTEINKYKYKKTID